MPTTPFFPPSYFASNYFGNFLPMSSPVQPLERRAHDSEEEEAFSGILDEIRAATQVDTVELLTISEVPTNLRGNRTSIYVIPTGWADSDELDPQYRLRTVNFDTLIFVTGLDSASQIFELSRLSKLVTRSITGLPTGEWSIPALTRITKGDLQDKSRHPEKHVRLSFQFAYLSPNVL